QLVGGGPGGEHVRVGVAGGDLRDGVLLEANHVAVGEVVLGREPVGRIHKQGRDEGGGGERGEPRPEIEAAAQRVQAEKNHQRIERKKVAGEERASEDGKENGVGEDYDQN